jgi:hypothetical protein
MDEISGAKFDVFGWVLSIFNPGGVSERDFETGRALYF